MLSPRKTAIGLLAFDLAALGVVFNLTAYARGIIPFGSWIIEPLIVPALFVAIAFHLIDGYKSRTDMMSLDYTSEHIIAVLAAFVATMLFTFAFLTGGYPLQQSRGVIALSFLAYIPLSLGYRRAIYADRLSSRKSQSLVFIGDESSFLTFSEECKRMGFHRPQLPVDTQHTDNSMIEDILDKIDRRELDVEAIVIRENNREFTGRIPQRLVELYFHGVPSYTLELFHQVYWRKIPLYRLNQTWLFQEGFKIAREPVFERLKRISDILLSLLALTLGAPLFVAVAATIWLDDRGSILFTQTRIGKNRVPFRLFKFRTMRPNDGKQSYTQVGDMRITRIGGFLRTSRLDELPQMINVLLGDMSLIGPRAEWDKLVDQYEKEIPCYHFRHLVKPGITGWAQVNYPYGANLNDTLRKLEYDLYYIRHFSFLVDASILLKTIHIMLFGKGR